MSTAVHRDPGSPPALVPADLDAERRVLGILIRAPHHVDTAVERLRAEHFFDPVHRRIFQIILELYQERGRISYTQIYDRLRHDRAIAAPDQVLIAITESYVHEAELLPGIEILLDKYGRRRLLEAAEQIQRMLLLEDRCTLAEAQARAQELIFEAAGQVGLESDVKDLIEVLNKCYERLVERREGRRPYGLLLRYPSIDSITTGLKNKDLIVLAARPSMGKTALALNFAVNVARRHIPVLIFSLEMDDEQIGDRLIISELFRYRSQPPEVTARDYATVMDDEKFARTQQVFNDLYRLPIKIVDRRGLSVAEIRAKARRVKAECPQLGLVIIDYLQLIRPPADWQGKNWAVVVGDIVRELRDLAGELDLPILVLSQLNRGVEAREDKRPRMSDLRDSGNIEEFADVVMFLYREDYYDPEGARKRGTEGVVDVIIAKHRKGPTGTARLKFVREFTRFNDEAAPELVRGLGDRGPV